MFGKQKNLLQDGDFILLRSRVSNLELEIEKFKSQLISLRGLVNRKLGGNLQQEETDKSISADGLDELRKANAKSH